MVRHKKALTVANILNQKINRVKFQGEMYQAFREPQNKGVWFVWGGSSSGKSTFLMQLAKEFCRNKLKAIHNLLEEETDDSDYVERVEYLNMSDVKEYYHALSYGYEEFCTYLTKAKQIKVILIDSGGYFFKDFAQYLEFKKKFSDRIIIISGHAQGANPRSELEKSIMYDAKQKVFVSGLQAACKGRTIGPNGGFYTIWQEGFEKLRGQTTT